MTGSVDFCLPILGANDCSRSDSQNKNTSKQDVELAKELIQKIKAFEKVGLGQRLTIAAFVTGTPHDTSWMMEGAKEGILVKEPDDRCYKICKMMAKQGFIRAMNFDSKSDNV